MSIDVVAAFEQLCAPAKFYLIASLLNLLFTSNTELRYKNNILPTLLRFFMSLLLIVAITMLLSFLCNRGMTTVAWIIALLPLLLLLFAGLAIFTVFATRRNPRRGRR